MAEYKVLLVDDDVDFVEATKIVLESNGYEAATAYNGKEGIAKAKEAKPDAIILDVMMTHKTEGFDTAQAHLGLIVLAAVSDDVAREHEEPGRLWRSDCV